MELHEICPIGQKRWKNCSDVIEETPSDDKKDYAFNKAIERVLVLKYSEVSFIPSRPETSLAKMHPKEED